MVTSDNDLFAGDATHPGGNPTQIYAFAIDAPAANLNLVPQQVFRADGRAGAGQEGVEAKQAHTAVRPACTRFADACLQFARSACWNTSGSNLLQAVRPAQ
jgi:hypothetical protein